MDHVWDGFYSGQIRASRFPAMVELMPGDSPRWTEIEFTGSPAKKMKFTLKSQGKNLGTKIRIYYPSALSRNIIIDG